jgi:hypothetical protein
MIFNNYRYLICVIFLSLFTFLFYGCTAYKYGSTCRDADDTYLLVTGDKENFGDKRLSYNEYLYRCSSSTKFFCNNHDGKGKPDFIYEYITDTKKRGIEMFFAKHDSVFAFEETKLKPFDFKLIESRKINDEENLIFQKLQETNKMK